jgi:hypothetical protein
MERAASGVTNSKVWKRLSTKLLFARIGRYPWDVGGGPRHFGGSTVILQNSSTEEVIAYLQQLHVLEELEVKRIDWNPGRANYGYVHLGGGTDGDPQSGNSYDTTYQFLGVLKKTNGKFMIVRWKQTYRTPAG